MSKSVKPLTAALVNIQVSIGEMQAATGVVEYEEALTLMHMIRQAKQVESDLKTMIEGATENVQPSSVFLGHDADGMARYRLNFAL